MTQVSIELMISIRQRETNLESRHRSAKTIFHRNSQFITGVPPLRDSGFQTNMRIWIGLFAPTGTSRDIVQRLNTDINALLKQDDYVGKFLYSQGMVPVGGGVEEFNQHMRDERAFYEKLLKETGVKLAQ